VRIFPEVFGASIGKRILVSVAAAIIPLAVIVVLVAISFRTELGENELTGALPTSSPAGPPEVKPVRPPAALIVAPTNGDAETAPQSPGVSRELVKCAPPASINTTLSNLEHNSARRATTDDEKWT
jgi:hypothetical protein